MSTEAAQEYVQAILTRYLSASKKAKRFILDELCQVCGYNRKYAIRLLNQTADKTKSTLRKKKPGRPKLYHDPLIFEVLQPICKPEAYTLFQTFTGSPRTLATLL